ncbi:FHA domain-containing protein [Methylobacter sp. Wu8]|uniref:Type III secretion system (T3SS) inner membrane Yop/YscD-like protein n=1 Tax=Methylobacter tundripaludum TaxID=173365 RepID=A0A2S6GXL5_9GAMM|nr:FHA domain-containing protein [Methylobacter tundripaludum]MCF7966994.1 FHA domain-containing protein [Methylobacter tundripaludum]MCK9637834.1 FHA domain-containing protein [Methylobacter tundripaludum]PPK69982.1 type III secretion system (T3SS) inner membrane Yop/YscD-like protein [Methylobacter tundripaludum]
MAKLTVFFKDKAIHSSLFENGIVHIGRDESNDLTIDSLTVAPAHAVIIIGDDDCTIKQLNDEFPLIINGEETKTRILNDNDMISMGKHGVMFNTAEPIELKSLSQTANLQFMTGDNIGKILQLKKPMARLGRDGNGVVAISRRKDGYFVSVLENSGTITVNNEPLNDKALKLNTNDVLVIDNTSLQFFLN